jgi:shikimate kinase
MGDEVGGAATGTDAAARHVVLVGLMGAGKSTVGSAVARRLKRDFVDLDDVVARREGMAVAEVITSKGEASFRRVEATALADVLSGPPVVLATGGGAVLDPASRQLMQRGAAGGSSPIVVWLDAPVSTLVARVAPRGAAQRPLLADGDPDAVLTRLDDERRAHYQEVASVVVDAGRGNPGEVAHRVLDAVSEVAAS